MIVTSADSDYLKQLEIIRKIRDTTTATDDINLPQICVIGDQSSGKSSFLSRLTGISFPTAAKMCTKAATVVTCNRDTSLTAPIYEIEDCDRPGTYVKVQSTAKAIIDTQTKLLKKNRRAQDDNFIVKDQAIKLRVTSANVIDIIIVDLPGIQHAGDTKEDIDTLIEENIEKPETLNLIVSEAKQDAELTKAIELAAKYDPSHERTLRVLTKFDNFDTPETQKRALKLIQEGLTASVSKQLNLGPHAIISLGKDGKLRLGKKDNISEKKQLVQLYKVPESRAGIVPLKARLQPVFANLIKTCLPALKQNVSDRLSETEHQLGKVGSEPASPSEILSRCHQLLVARVAELECTLTKDCFLPMKEKIWGVRKRITPEFATGNFEMNSFQCTLFQGQTMFDQAAVEIRNLWEPILNNYIKTTKEAMSDSIHALRKDAGTRIYGPLISAISAEYEEYLREVVLPPFRDACKQALEEERFYGTTNHYFDAKFREAEICPPEVISSFMTKAESLWNDASRTARHRQNSEFRVLEMSDLQECLEDAKKQVAEKQVHEDLMETQKKRVFAAVIAHFDVEKKTFVDVILKKTKEILIEGHAKWIKVPLLRSKSIFEAAKEDEGTSKLRKELLGRIGRLNECMPLLRDVPLPERRVDVGGNTSAASSESASLGSLTSLAAYAGNRQQLSPPNKRAKLGI